MFIITGPLLDSIFTSGGIGLKNEFDAERKRSGDVFLTKGYSLPCKYVVHINLPNDANATKPILKEGFKYLQKLNIKSLALPCIGKNSSTYQGRFLTGFLFPVYPLKKRIKTKTLY